MTIYLDSEVVLCIHAGSDVSGDETGIAHLPNLTAIQMVESLSEWNGVDDVISVFQDLTIAESGQLPLMRNVLLCMLSLV